MRKRSREIFIHILPVLLGIVITLMLSGLTYHQMMAREREGSWEKLDTVATTMAEKVTIRFEDNLNLMERVADAISLKDEVSQRETILSYLDSVRDSTIFQRIDIWLPDGTVLHETGERHSYDQDMLVYQAEAAKGAHYTSRLTDRDTKREAIYCIVPIEADGETEALLVGVVDCLSLSDYIRARSFGGTCQLFLVDCTDGSYLMDNWHPTLGNIHIMGSRERLPGYEDVEFWDEMLNRETGRVAFYSKSNGKPSYMAYVPVEGFNWSMAVAAQEEQVLKNVHELTSSLQKIAVVEILLLTSYLVWNVFIANVLVKQRRNVQQMKLETATNEAKSVFLSSVSHDIRTPLNGILGMLDVIDKRRNDEAQVNEGLKKIRVSAEYLVTLADNVLDLNDLESGKGQILNERIDLRKLKPEMDIIVQSKLKDTTVSYQMEYGILEHPLVLGSDGYLHRILTNLVGNAIKYNKEHGSIWVKVEEVEQRNGSSLYCFTVKDTGIGMSEAFRKNMFQAFQQENAGARSSHTGHGLGLAIVDRMVKKMGGTVHVESVKGEGSAFTVTIPFSWDLDGESQELIKEEARGEIGLHGAKILLAEDNELNLEIAQILLEESGAEITAAIHGRMAVEAFAASEEGYYDAILMDIMMPEMDGCEASQAIRGMKRKDAKQVPIIAMTASTFAEDIQRCRDAGMNEHVGKPLDMNTVIAMVYQFRKMYRKQDS